MFFLVSEVVLNLTGRLYYAYRVDNKPAAHKSSGSKEITILCAGDSFSFGVGASKGNSYPEQLGRFLAENLPEVKCRVINIGIPGQNSSQLSNRLESNIKIYRPDILVLLTGTNNNSNFEENNYFLFQKNINSHLSRLNNFLTQFKTYKLASLCVKSITNRFYKTSLPVKYIRRFEYKLEDVFQTNMEEGVKFFENGKSEKAINEFNKVLSAHPDCLDARIYLARIYLHCTPLTTKAIEEFNKALELDPYNQHCLYDLANAYYRIKDNKSALKILRRLNAYYPSNKTTRQLITYGFPEEVNYDNTDLFKKVLMYDLKNIKECADKNNVIPVICSYLEGGRGGINEDLKEFAIENNILFVDNFETFNKLSAAPDFNRSEYFVEDGHCNDKGYGVMAQTVFSVVKPVVLEKQEK